jgi:HSP20 family protein
MKKKKEKDSSNWLDKEEGKLAIDLIQKSKNFIVQAPIAGVKEEDLDIRVENDILNIQGLRPEPEKNKEKGNYLLKECYWGKFSRQISLPDNVDLKHVKASLKEGILTIIIPRLDKEEGKKVKIS